MTRVTSKRLAISTSREPSQRTRTLCRELQRMLPSSAYIQRGKQSLSNLFQEASKLESRSLLLIGERDGNPGNIHLYSIDEPQKPVLSLRIEGVKLAREHPSHAQAPTDNLSISAHGGKFARKLAETLMAHFAVGIDSDRRRRPETRVLAIDAERDDIIRMTFRSSPGGEELGPSLTVSWAQI